MTPLPEKSLSHKQPHNGFTLIEALIVLSIWSVLLLIALPVQHSIIAQKELKQFLHQLEDDVLGWEKEELIKGEHVTLGENTNGKTFVFLYRKG